MKTAPIQQTQTQTQENSHETLGNASEVKAMSPPTFQLTASEDVIQKTPQGSPELLTITDGNALLRSGPPAFDSLKTNIPRGTRVEVLEEAKKGNSAYIRVKDHDSGAELGWTWKGNAANLDQKYKASNSTYTYHVDGHDLLVFLPKGGITKSNVDVFMFLHGRGGDYTTSKTRKETHTYEDNPAVAGKIPEAVSNSGNIAICPQANDFYAENDWGAIKAGGYQKMVDTTLSRLSTDLGMTEPLTAGNVSLAGHSAGGNGLGQASLDTGATDVTLQEAGYNFLGSWKKLRDWFLLGDAPKTMRVITQGNDNGAATRKPVREATKRNGREVVRGATFSTTEIVRYSQQLAKAGKLAGPVTVEEFKGDGKVEDGGIVMERGYRVLNSDGSLQGSLRLYHLADKGAGHWDAAAQTMETSMTSGATDRAADAEAMKKK